MRMLCSLSASLMMMTRTSRVIASRIFRIVSAFCTVRLWPRSCEILVTPCTSSATWGPKPSRNSSSLTPVSSIAS